MNLELEGKPGGQLLAGYGIHLKKQIARVGKFGLNGLAHRIFAVKSSFDYLFHDRNIPDIFEKTIHLHHIFKGQPG